MIRLLGPADAPAYILLRRESLLDAPLAFASSPEDDFANDPEAVKRATIFGAYYGEALIGAAGVFRERYRKSAHKAHVWGMYVTPAHRGTGVGGRLLEAVIAHARSLEGVTWLQLAVSSAAPEARRLYERAGFVAWGEEPEALAGGGASASLHHMALRL